MGPVRACGNDRNEGCARVCYTHIHTHPWRVGSKHFLFLPHDPDGKKHNTAPCLYCLQSGFVLREMSASVYVCVCSVLDHAWLYQCLLFCVCSGPGCGTVALVQSPLAMQSPDYPRSYGDNNHCRWVIYVPEGYVVKVTGLEGHGLDVRLARSARLWT